MFCSVAMSTYNGERFLAEQLSSICAQTRPVDEIVVSDDGSSDGTLRILDDFRLAHPQIHWKILPSAENHGFRESFLRALKACGGDLIFLCDQDDRWAPDKVETMLRPFEANPAMLSLISDFKTIDANGNLLNPNAPTENLWVSDRVLRAPASPTQITPIRNARPQSGAGLRHGRAPRTGAGIHPPEPALDARLDSQPAGRAARRAVLLPRAAPVLPSARLQRHRHGAGRARAAPYSLHPQAPTHWRWRSSIPFWRATRRPAAGSSSVFRWRPTNPSSKRPPAKRPSSASATRGRRCKPSACASSSSEGRFPISRSS